MKKFYCFGKNGFCEYNRDCTDCSYLNGLGGEYREFGEKEAAAEISEGFKYLRRIIQEAMDKVIPLCKELVAAISKMIELYPNKRVIYLATHGKGRTRKKNINRILKYFEREGKKRAEFGP